MEQLNSILSIQFNIFNLPYILKLLFQLKQQLISHSKIRGEVLSMIEINTKILNKTPDWCLNCLSRDCLQT